MNSWRGGAFPSAFCLPAHDDPVGHLRVLRRLLERLARDVGDAQGVLEEPLAGRAELHALAAPFEKPRADLRLEGAHAPADRGLREVERLGGAADVPAPCDLEERAEVELDGAMLRR
jgi:hypothetical protein